MTATHAITMNGQVHGELKHPDMSSEDDLRMRIGLLDGTVRYSFMLWRVPEGKKFGRIDLRKFPKEYLQVAGGGDRFTVEQRKLVATEHVHEVLGRSGDAMTEDQPDEVIRWDEYETAVRPNEVFTLAEVQELFVTYYRTDDLPESFTRRRLQSP